MEGAGSDQPHIWLVVRGPEGSPFACHQPERNGARLSFINASSS